MRLIIIPIAIAFALLVAYVVLSASPAAAARNAKKFVTKHYVRIITGFVVLCLLYLFLLLSPAVQII